jgi:hypothetical protein
MSWKIATPGLDQLGLAREWRDQELKDTDWIVSIVDHPQHGSYMAYRVVLRNWPTTANFPALKPTLGA